MLIIPISHILNISYFYTKNFYTITKFVVNIKLRVFHNFIKVRKIQRKTICMYKFSQSICQSLFPPKGCFRRRKSIVNKFLIYFICFVNWFVFVPGMRIFEILYFPNGRAWKLKINEISIILNNEIVTDNTKYRNADATRYFFYQLETIVNNRNKIRSVSRLKILPEGETSCEQRIA